MNNSEINELKTNLKIRSFERPIEYSLKWLINDNSKFFYNFCNKYK